jgi:hypothetical protein
MSLRAWDERWLPRAAAVVQGWSRTLAGVGRRSTGPGTLVGEGLRRQPALAGSALAVGLAGLVIAVAGGPGGPSDGQGSTASPAPSLPVPVVSALGPAPGTSVISYADHASADLARFADTAQGRPGYAIVDLRRYLEPAQTQRVFAGVQVVRAYVRVAVRGLPTQVHAIPLQGTFQPLDDGMQASGRLAAATAKTFHVLVSQLSDTSSSSRQLKARYALQERASAYEGQRLQQPATCACVFAVVVHASLDRLRALAAAPEVRVVDPAVPAATLDALTIFPLEPEITTVVPRGGLFGG